MININTTLKHLTNGVSIVVVTYNSQNEIDNLWSSIKELENSNISFEAIFIDNNSTDKTREKLKKIKEEKNYVTLVLNETNLGLAAANNQAIPEIRKKYTLILNPDIILHKDNTINELVQYLEKNDECVAVAPINLDGEGKKHSSFHKDWGIGHIIIWRFFPINFTRWIYKKIRQYETNQVVLFASGSCLMIRSENFIRIGGYDPNYFLTVEDVCDLCIRLKKDKLGSTVNVISQAKVTHLISRSAKTVPLITQWEGIKGSIYHSKKHEGKFSAITVTIALLISTIIRTFVATIKSPFSKNSRSSLINNLIIIRRIIIENPLIKIPK